MREKQLLKLEFLFYNAKILKIMMTWKIVRASTASVLYRYIDERWGLNIIGEIIILKKKNLRFIPGFKFVN